MMKRALRTIAILSMLLMMTGCNDAAAEISMSGSVQAEGPTVPEKSDDLQSEVEEAEKEEVGAEADILEQEPDLEEGVTVTGQLAAVPATSINEIPEYTGNAYAVINNNIPYFTDSELSAASYEYYSGLDALGRCGVCMASIGQDIMPAEERGEIGSVKPAGWQTVKYPGIVDGNYLYNRCHLIGFQLTGENANVNNLITGTRYMNVEGMLPFENMVADFVKETGYHVIYRATPVFDGDNLVADGVLIEAKSVEDNGSGILFNVFCYNVQPGIIIDYATGNSIEDETVSAAAEEPSTEAEKPSTMEENTESVQQIEQAAVETPQPAAEGISYVLNTNTKKFHHPWCSSVDEMKAKNREDFTGSRDDVIARGFVPCKRCNP